jgi:hypothetical protein
LTDLVVGAPAWDRAWSMPLWFESVKANCDPARTGLVFVVPSTDDATRNVIAAHADDFSWVEVLRDQGVQSTRQERPATNHETLARARNAILRVVERVSPRRYLSWDTDFVVEAGAVERMDGLMSAWGLPLVTPWAWLNRQPPRRMRYYDGRDFHDVLVQDPVMATGMGMTRHGPRHFPGSEYLKRASTPFWPVDIALAFQLMGERAYRVASYRPHPAGEDVPFNMQLRGRGIGRHVVGGVRAVHLYDRGARDEIALGWPRVLKLSEQAPLQATYEGQRSREYEALGFYPAPQPQEIAA